MKHTHTRTHSRNYTPFLSLSVQTLKEWSNTNTQQTQNCSERLPRAISWTILPHTKKRKKKREIWPPPPTWFINSRQLLRSSRKSSHNNYQDLYTLSVGTKQTRAPVGCQCRRFKMATRWGICSTGLIANDFCSALKSLPISEHEVREARWRNVEFIVAYVCCQSVTIAMRKTHSWRVRLSAYLIDCRCSAGVWSV